MFCTVFACRMTLNLRDYGRRTIRGLDPQPGVLSGISGFTVEMDPLVFTHADLDLGVNQGGAFPVVTEDSDSNKHSV